MIGRWRPGLIEDPEGAAQRAGRTGGRVSSDHSEDKAGGTKHSGGREELVRMHRVCLCLPGFGKKEEREQRMKFWERRG